jgi:hypothetical protein
MRGKFATKAAFRYCIWLLLSFGMKKKMFNAMLKIYISHICIEIFFERQCLIFEATWSFVFALTKKRDSFMWKKNLRFSFGCLYLNWKWMQKGLNLWNCKRFVIFFSINFINQQWSKKISNRNSNLLRVKIKV